MASESYNLVTSSPTLVSHNQPSAARAFQSGSPGQMDREPVGKASAANAAAGFQGTSALPIESSDSARPKDETAQQVTQAVERINEIMQSGRNTLKFELNEDAGQMVIQVLDAQSEELIRQIPSEETLKFAEYVEGLVGIIFNDKA